MNWLIIDCQLQISLIFFDVFGWKLRLIDYFGRCATWKLTNWTDYRTLGLSITPFADVLSKYAAVCPVNMAIEYRRSNRPAVIYYRPAPKPEFFKHVTPEEYRKYKNGGEPKWPCDTIILPFQTVLPWRNRKLFVKLIKQTVNDMRVFQSQDCLGFGNKSYHPLDRSHGTDFDIVWRNCGWLQPPSLISKTWRTTIQSAFHRSINQPHSTIKSSITGYESRMITKKWLPKINRTKGHSIIVLGYKFHASNTLQSIRLLLIYCLFNFKLASKNMSYENSGIEIPHLSSVALWQTIATLGYFRIPFHVKRLFLFQLHSSFVICYR